MVQLRGSLVINFVQIWDHIETSGYGLYPTKNRPLLIFSMVIDYLLVFNKIKSHQITVFFFLFFFNLIWVLIDKVNESLISVVKCEFC
jgi:hypothetical protein